MLSVDEPPSRDARQVRAFGPRPEDRQAENAPPTASNRSEASSNPSHE